ncbi:Uncharacterised protein [Mycobacteroides abscessus subsp. abscessus]|nr:Uncharacterised protein [Mycobacteroides abscessus subsp. abscessus]
MNFEGFSLEITGDHLCQRHFVVDHQCPVVRDGTCGGSARRTVHVPMVHRELGPGRRSRCLGRISSSKLQSFLGAPIAPWSR